MYKGVFLFVCLACLSVVVYPNQSVAYNPGDSIVMSVKTDDVVVVGFKGNGNLSGQPSSATLVPGSLIKQLQISSIKELSATIPNFFMPDYGSKYSSPVYIRGIGSRINAPSVGLYVDGIPYFDRSSFDFDLSDVERVEVLRGPQGTLYGRNTMGGIINVFTKSPFRRKETNATVSAGNHNAYRAGISHTNNIGGKFGYSVSANYRHEGGYYDNITRDEKADKNDLFSGRIRLGWDIRPGLVAYLTSAYEYSDQKGYPYGVYNEETGQPGKIDYNGNSYYRRHTSNNGLTIDYTASQFKISSQTSYQYIKGTQGVDQDFTPADVLYVGLKHDQHLVSQETNIRSTTNHNYQWQFGVFGFYQRSSQTNDVGYLTKDSTGLTRYSNPDMGFALYHQSTYDNLFVKGLSATVGIRFDWEKTKMDNRSEGMKGDSYKLSTVTGKDIYTQFTPKFALKYTFRNDNLIYASVTKGYKSGGFNTTAELSEDRVYKPESSWSYELGAKGRFFDDNLDASIALFYIDWRDQQITQRRATDQGFKMRNAGKSVSKGVEASAHLFPQKRFNVLLNYGFTYAKFDEYIYDDQNNKNIDYSDNFLSMVPRQTVSAGVNYSIPLKGTWMDEVRLGAQYNGVGKIYWNDDNANSQGYYQLVNAQVALTRKNISVEFWGKNLAGEKYVTYYFETGGQKFAQRGKPLTFGVNLQLKF